MRNENKEAKWAGARRIEFVYLSDIRNLAHSLIAFTPFLPLQLVHVIQTQMNYGTCK